jgi:hypothetical protein
MIRRPAGSGRLSNAAAAASSAGPMAVRPFELRLVLRTAAAKAAPLSTSPTRCHPTVILIWSGSDHSRTSTSIPPGTVDTASTSLRFSKARAIPFRCST